MKYKLNLVVVLLMMVALSCKEEVKPTPYTYTKIFTGENSRTWKVKYLEETLNGSVVARFTDNCFTDDRYTLYANPERLYIADSGSRICDDEEAGIASSWGFTNATATLSIAIPFLSSNTLPFFVRDVDDNDMELEIFFDEAGTASYRIFLEMTDED